MHGGVAATGRKPRRSCLPLEPLEPLERRLGSVTPQGLLVTCSSNLLSMIHKIEHDLVATSLLVVGMRKTKKKKRRREAE